MKHNEQTNSGVLFQGLNEAITENQTIKSFLENRSKIQSELQVDDKSFEEIAQFIQGPLGFYYHQREVLNLVIKKVSQNYKESEKDTWERLRDGTITGNMMHLRRIERTFGKGTLRTLALMRGNESEFIMNSFKTLLTTDDENEKNAVIQKILSIKGQAQEPGIYKNALKVLRRRQIIQ